MTSPMQVVHYIAFTSRLPVRFFMLLCIPGMLIQPFSADPLSLITAIHAQNMKAGVAISPDTPSNAITDEIGEKADMLLVMTVYPGMFVIWL